MGVREVASRFVELCNQGRNFEVMETMYAPDIVSVEVDGSETAGQPQVIEKSRVFQRDNPIQSEKVRGPFFHGPDRFAVHFAFEVTRNATGQRELVEEIGVYTVRSEKITREQFFLYDGERRPR